MMRNLVRWGGGFFEELPIRQWVFGGEEGGEMGRSREVRGMITEGLKGGCRRVVRY